MQQSKPIIIAGKDTGYIYETTDGEHLTNLTTGREGTREQITTSLVIPLRLNAMCEKNENLKELILILGLAIER
jgi:hypothetical protein